MWSRNRSGELGNSGFAILVTTLVHVAGFELFVLDLRYRHRVEKEAAFRSELFFLSDPLRVDPISPPPVGTRKRLKLLKPRASLPQSARGETLPTTATVPIDWYDAASLATAAVVTKSQEPRLLDSKPQTIPKPEVYEKGLFDRGPAHKVGTIEPLGGADFRTWVTPYCYVLSGMGPQGREDVGHCQSSRAAEGGSGLFEELKPKYLKKAPP